jgi:hypothetical protein
VGAGKGERASVVIRVGELEDHRPLVKPAITRPERLRHGIPNTFEARSSGCQDVSASTISSYRARASSTG